MPKYLNRNNQNYWVIGVLSLILMIFLPMAGSVAGLGWVFPTTTAGWIVYITTKLCATGLNMLIFHHFVIQARINIRDNANYLEAEKLLNGLMPDTTPIGPKEYFGKQYAKKGTTLAITTILSTVCITQAVLTFDYVSFIVHILVVIFAIVFGVQTMREDEEWWIRDYLIYARYMVQQKKKE